MALKLEGVVCSMVTPFDASGEIDEETLRRHIEFEIAAGIHGLLFIGGCGEFVSLDDRERRRIIDQSTQIVNGRVPAIIGIISPGTNHVVELARFAKAAGCDAVMVLPPFYINPSVEGVYEHFYTIADQGGLPLVVYNNPKRTNIDLDAALLSKLVEIDAIVALKDCSRDLGSISEKIHAVGNRISILSGEDDLAFPSLLLGAHGGMWAVPNLFPSLFVEMYREVREGHTDVAREIHYRLLPFIKSSYIVNHPGPLKEAMSMADLSVGAARQPLQPSTTEQRQALRLAVESLGALRASVTS